VIKIYYEEMSDVCDGYDDLESIADNRDFCISMTWRSNLKELGMYGDAELSASQSF
jgi:hypothetical protein